MTTNTISIYIHWPFCKSLCPYCDFNSHLAEIIDNRQWIESYKKELDHFSNRIQGRYITSIFFGGGTPSLMDPTIIEELINHISKLGTIDDNTEITIEANPTSYETQKFNSFKAAGINRVSIGVQSINDDALKQLGREHSATQALKAIESAATIFDRYSFDLIYARSSQSLKSWESELSETLNYVKGHISLYQLTIEKGTPFFIQHREGKLIIPGSDLAADMYECTNELLKKHSLYQYEISNYSKPGQECRHNLAYWQYDEYIGIGPGAHSRIHHQDTETEAIMMYHPPNTWLAKVNENGNGIQKSTKLSKEEQIEEFLMMTLRVNKGTTNTESLLKTGFPIEEILNLVNLNMYTNNGFALYDRQNLSLTEKGLMLHSYIVPRLVRLFS